MANEELVQLIQGGRDDLMPQLWEQCRGWVAKMAIRWHTAFDGRRGVELDDLINAGYIALVRAVESYDPSAGGAFITWLTYHIKTAFCDTFGIGTEKGRRGPLNNAASLDVPLSADDPDGETLVDFIADPAGATAFDVIEDADYNRSLHDALEEALSSIDQKCADAIRRRWFDGQTQQEIAASCGVSHQMVRERERRGFSQLRRGKALAILQPFNAHIGTGFQAWKQSGLSVQERYILLKEQNERLIV